MTATKGHMTPLFVGEVALVLSQTSRVGSVSERFIGDNHNRLSQIEESGSAALLDLAMSHPPL